MLDAMPPPSQCAHEFSSDHQAKMETLFAQDRRRTRKRAILQRVAVFFLAALVGVSVWLGVNTEARAAFFTWVQETYEGRIVYRYFREPAADQLPNYRITWVPEEYEAVDVFSGPTLFSALYQIGDDISTGLVIDYSFAHSNMYIELEMGDTPYTEKNLMVNGVQADFYLSSDPEETNLLIWYDEDAGIVFSINGFLDESVMLHIAESIILED
jgi:hypothetical protein